MGRLEFEHYLYCKEREGDFPPESAVGIAGSALCGDAVRFAVSVDGDMISKARYLAEGCGASRAAACACAELVEGRSIFEAALISPQTISAELGGLDALKAHAADLAADSLHAALSEQLARGLRGPVDQTPGRVLVAMSGGVDSAVAALLSRKQGAEVLAVTLKLWSDPATDGTKSCCSPQAVLSARALSHHMGIPHFTLDLRTAFREHVVDNYIAEHSAGNTPNPCVRCNGMVRFDAMLELASQIGAKRLVTGHYAKVESDDEGLLIATADDRDKDQSYMLASLDPSILERIEFPLANMTKTEARDLARESKLPVAEKAESQDLCFLAGTDRRSFLKRQGDLQDRPGDIVINDGTLVGHHSGYHNYTVGQRRGLGIAAAEPQYVLSTDMESNRVMVGNRSELMTGAVEIGPAELYRSGERVDRVKLRYRQTPLPCRVVDGAVPPGHHLKVLLRLDRPVDGVSPGQTACLLQGNKVVGWGTIAGAVSDEHEKPECAPCATQV